MPKTVQFGVLRQQGAHLSPTLVPVDANVQAHLERMFNASDPQILGRAPEPFQLAEKYSESQCAILPFQDDLAKQIRDIYAHENLVPDPSVLDELGTVKAYFSTITDDEHRTLGIRQATQFKTLRHKPLAVLANGQLGLESRPLFKLDETWDVFTDGNTITVLSATALERICDLSPEIRNSAVAGLQELAPKMSYLEMAPLEGRVASYTRSARIVADLRKRNDLTTVGIEKLQAESTKQRLEYQVVDGRYIVKVGSEEGLLMLLDRRRYADPLIEVDPAIYEADSRRKIEP